PVSLGFVNLANSGNIILALMASGAQFFQTKMMSTGTSTQQDTEGSEDENMMSMMNKQMQYVMPFITFFIGYTLPAGVALYWFLSAGTTAVQQKMIGLGGSEEDSDEDDDTPDEKNKDEDKQQDSGSEDEEVIEGELVD
ncbi:MAG: YidC/Oxa1 family membrane protein insertase, partial [Candidatus Paceibacteria bacterium]